MRTVLLAMTVPLMLLVAQAKTDAKKPDGKKIDVGNGRIAWFDITTTDLAKSREFYGKLFDWKFNALAGAETLAAEIVAGDTAIGTLRKAEGKLSPYDGVVYVQVADIEVACKKATELGGTIPPGFPFDLTGDKEGAIALVVDPSGHPMGMYSRTPMAKAKSTK